MSVLPGDKLRLEVRRLPSRSVVFLVGVLLLIAWGTVDPALGWIALIAVTLAVIGLLQILGRIPSFGQI